MSRNSRPESRNRIVCLSSTTLAGGNVERTADHVDGGLLTMVNDQQQSSARNNPDPLVSLIQSLAEISPIRSSQSVTNNNNNKTDANDHHAPSIGSATTTTTTTASSNVVNAITNCSPNQSPKAWQNCTQVCPPVSSILAQSSFHCSHGRREIFIVFSLSNFFNGPNISIFSMRYFLIVLLIGESVFFELKSSRLM